MSFARGSLFNEFDAEPGARLSIRLFLSFLLVKKNENTKMSGSAPGSAPGSLKNQLDYNDINVLSDILDHAPFHFFQTLCFYVRLLCVKVN